VHRFVRMSLPRAGTGRALLGLAATLLAGAAGPAAAQSDGATARPTASVLDLGAGGYDIIGDHQHHRAAAVNGEFRYGQTLYGIGPAAGVIVNSDGGGMVYAALYHDFVLGPVVVTPLAGAGAWWRGGRHDENLGGTFQFRLGIEAAYRFADDSRLGLRFGHISNDGIHRVNPGENDLMLTYALPLGF
jgi:lipid A 3-O-deacylase